MATSLSDVSIDALPSDENYKPNTVPRGRVFIVILFLVKMVWIQEGGTIVLNSLIYLSIILYSFFFAYYSRYYFFYHPVILYFFFLTFIHYTCLFFSLKYKDLCLSFLLL